MSDSGDTNGLGTKESPKEVKTWDEFVTEAGKDNNYIKFPDTATDNNEKVIDMTKHEPFTSNAVELKCAEINGNGWTINGIYMKANNANEIWAFHSTQSNGPIIYDLSITNLYLDRASNGFYKGVFRRSSTDKTYKITAVGHSDAKQTLFDFPNVTGASIAFEANGTMIFADPSYSSDFINCNIYLTGYPTPDQIQGAFDHCYISGTQVFRTQNNQTQTTFSYTNFDSDSNSSILDMTITESTGEDTGTKLVKLQFGGAASATRVSVVNTSHLPTSGYEIKSTVKNLVAVTDEDLKDPKKLKEKGFEIGEEAQDGG